MLPRLDEIEEIFAYWQVVVGQKRARLTADKEKVIAGRLREGYSMQDLKDAIQGCKWSPFHSGKNDRNTVYQDITLILRDAAHVDRFLDIYERHTHAAALRRRNEEAVARARAGVEIVSGEPCQRADWLHGLRSIVGGKK